MTETYTLVGTDPSWIVAFMPVPAVVMGYFVRKKRLQTPKVAWQAIVIVVYFFVTAVWGLPMEWIVAGAGFGASIGFLVLPNKTMTKPMRIGFGITWGLLAIPFLLLCRISNDQLSLGESSATFRESHSTNTVPRHGLEILTSDSDPWFDIRPYSSWTSFSGQGKHQNLGPHIAGFMIFWGPHGLIRGDDLALHYAHWAGVAPMVQTKHGDDYAHTPLPGFTP